MKCQNEVRCEGNIDTDRPIELAADHGSNLETGEMKISREVAFPCGTCGRLHWMVDGAAHPVFNGYGYRGFLEDGRVVSRDSDGDEDGLPG